jgi:hypothetical protein
MAFDFMDLFPDSPAAVVGSQGARDILENQYKQAMGALEMENALIKSVAMKKEFMKQQQMEPLNRTLDAVKLLQGVNLRDASAFQGLDFDNLDASSLQIIKDAAASGNLMSTPEMDREKATLSGAGALARAQLTSGVSAQNNRNSNDVEMDKFREAKALEVGKKWLDKKYRPIDGSTRQGQLAIGDLVATYKKMLAYGATDAAKGLFNVYSKELSANGLSFPGLGSKAQEMGVQPQSQPKPEAKPGAKVEKKPIILQAKSGAKYELSKDGIKEL